MNKKANIGRHLDKKTPVDIAAEKGHFGVMKMLLQSDLVNGNTGWYFDTWTQKQTGLPPMTSVTMSGSIEESGKYHL